VLYGSDQTSKYEFDSRSFPYALAMLPLRTLHNFVPDQITAGRNRTQSVQVYNGFFSNDLIAVRSAIPAVVSHLAHDDRTAVWDKDLIFAFFFVVMISWFCGLRLMLIDRKDSMKYKHLLQSSKKSPLFWKIHRSFFRTIRNWYPSLWKAQKLRSSCDLLCIAF